MARVLMIGLGGTGGRVLKTLYKRLNNTEKENANCLYFDLDKKDTGAAVENGVKTVRISSADNVLSIAEGLGEEDVFQWLPNGDAEKVFLTSGTDDGASQYRYKSRLCFSRFLKKQNNELETALRDLVAVGNNIAGEIPRIMIVSSVAGGTGTGSFLDVALYIRKFFRDHNQDVVIMGLFACPSLFKAVVTDDSDHSKYKAMKANAYAAVRELNAMNVSVSGGAGIESAYGKKVNIAIHTGSEGDLFNSKEAIFSTDATAYKNKPFDLMYFIDGTNVDGYIFTDPKEYENLMADVVYTRFFSALEGDIRSGESNELSSHAQYPTAIYGSSGYSEIRYPYKDVIRYLAKRKTCDEIGRKWSFAENKWKEYCQRRQQAAEQVHGFWRPEDGERRRNFTEILTRESAEKGSELYFLKNVLALDENGISARVTAYLDEIGDACAITEDAPYGLKAIKDVKAQDDSIRGTLRKLRNTDESYLETFSSAVGKMKSEFKKLEGVLMKAAENQSIMLSSAILDPKAEPGNTQDDKINLGTGLLTGGKDGEGRSFVHPLAARFFLCQLRDKIGEDFSGEKSNRMERYLRELDLLFDEDPSDNDDYTLDDEIRYLSKRWFKGKAEKLGKQDLEEYITAVEGTVEKMFREATKHLLSEAFRFIVPRLDALIAEYEGFFENVDQYRATLSNEIRNEQEKVERANDRLFYVGASENSNKYLYEKDPLVRNVLQDNVGIIHSAEGEGIYRGLLKRALRKADGTLTGKDDHYDDFGTIFKTVIDIYSGSLEEKVQSLKTDAFSAMLKEVCGDLGIAVEDIPEGENRVRVETEIKTEINDLLYRAKPMIQYSRHNRDKYFSKENDVSNTYAYLSVSKNTAGAIESFYGSLHKAAVSWGLSADPRVNEGNSDYSINCFSIIHCLQPTQITIFNEDNAGSLYRCYEEKVQKALQSGLLSMSPHIDKRWHINGMLPFISQKLEISWREKVAKAFLFCALDRRIVLTEDENRIRCFLSRLSDSADYLTWPGKERIYEGRISRVFEYLSENSALVESMAGKLDEAVQSNIDGILSYMNYLPTYKAMVTKNMLMKRLRENLLVYLENRQAAVSAHGRNLKAGKGRELTEEEREQELALRKEVLGNSEAAELLDDFVLPDTTGGLLHTAWLIHTSEENLDEDKDFGEEILAAAKKIIVAFCAAPFKEGIENDESSAQYSQFRNLYHHFIKQNIAYFVVSKVKELKIAPEDVDKFTRSGDQFDPLIKKSEENYYPDLKIPDNVLSDEEFVWLSKNWIEK